VVAFAVLIGVVPTLGVTAVCHRRRAGVRRRGCRYRVGSTVRSLAIHPSVLPDSMKTVRPGALSQTDTVGVSGWDGPLSSSVPDRVPVGIGVV